MLFLNHRITITPFLVLIATLFAFPAYAETIHPVINSGNTAWMIVSSAFVLLMLIPGLALFYGGLVKREDILATMMQSFLSCTLVSILWVVMGYSLVFTEGNGVIGGLSRLFLNGISMQLKGDIPETVFILYQLTFAAITVALLFGAVTDRMHFTAMLWFTVLWFIIVYIPVAHSVWGPRGFLGNAEVTDAKGFLGFGPVLDFAGGTVVHINAGVAGLIAALVLGKRRGKYQESTTPPRHNLVLSVMGACLLWVGWFGFNGGSAMAANEHAGMAVLVTHIAAAMASLSWMVTDWIMNGKPSVLGIISGAVAGLVAITPASGYVGVEGALAIGALAGIICYWSSTGLKEHFGFHDTLDVFGVHCIGGIVGAILTGVFARTDIGGVSGLIEGNFNQVIAQTLGVICTLAYAGIATYLILCVIRFFTPLRVGEDAETGLDKIFHGETANNE